MDNVIQMASMLPFFSGLTEKEIRSAISEMRESEFESGSIIFHEGDSGNEMFILTEGVIEITTRIGDALDKTLLTLRSSGLFGEMSLISGLPRSGTAKVLEKAKIMAINAESFRKFCIQMPAAGVKLQEHLLNTISDRLRTTTDLYRHAAEWGLNISGIIQLDFSRLVAEHQDMEIELSNGKSVNGVLLKVEKRENGIFELYLSTGNGICRIIPYHAVVSIGFSEKKSGKMTATKAGRD